MTPSESPKLPHPNIGIRLAAFLADRREQIISEWTASVHRDRMIASSETLTHSQLRDHLPQLLDNLSDTLCNAFSEDVKQQAAWTAATHGHMRWKEGYDISEVLREMRDLRAVLIPHLIEFQEHHPDVGAARQLFSTITVHRFLDDAIRISVEQFTVTGARTPRSDD